MAFTAKDVQALREKTGCGMMDCKKALTETNGDMEKAVEFLREKGLAAAAKKASRIAAEGLVCAYIDDAAKIGVLVEVNSETDFVAKNADFKAFVEGCAVTIAKNRPADVDALLAVKFDGSDLTVADVLREKVLVIGENLKIRRFQIFDGNLVSYIHGGGKIGVIVKFHVDDAVFATDAFKAYGKDVAMQVAAANPSYTKSSEVPAEVLDKEKEILTAQAINEGKPAAIAEKMVAGRIKKYYAENCLVDQAFVKDPNMSVTQYTESKAKEFGSAIEIVSFARFEKGEGLQKREDDFAAEVAAMQK
ncbi:translation elongation factor Ts [Feifania hominis]|uniref:Elongation factor Ts n=1 Tax=Feifania hominis TaxID=2763660 RepID=A0A926HTU4_9FIRM|nr:translation elongation factor Ts [Feifania hominis]MBC8535653.1 elongation factor Ts [Feifania hominis]